jgi:hypothetical protein
MHWELFKADYVCETNRRQPAGSRCMKATVVIKASDEMAGV